MSAPIKDPGNPDNAPLRPHTYDGIQEFDNRLPNWWLWTFYGAIIFSVVYWFSYFTTRVVPGDHKLIDAEMARIAEARLAAAGTLDDATLWEMSQNAGFVAQGKAVYESTCVACHGADLKGGIGQNLVDGQWRYGNTAMFVYHMVSDGSPDKASGMQAWAGQLGPAKVKQVVAYVLSHHNQAAMAAAPVERPGKVKAD